MTIEKLQTRSTPYTYILEWTKHGKRYIGARWAAGCHPDDLWSSYFTSSEYVSEFVKIHGNPDIILIDKTFDNAMDAMAREQELQHKFDVINNISFLNKAIGCIYNYNDPEIRKKISASLIGHKVSEETRKKLSLSRIGKPSARHGVNLSQKTKDKLRLANVGKKHSEESKKKMSIARKGIKFSEERKQKMRIPHGHQKNPCTISRKLPMKKCPHCDKIGSVNMSRWHFDNCKLKGV